MSRLGDFERSQARRGPTGEESEILAMDDDGVFEGQENAIGARFIDRLRECALTKMQGQLVAGAFEDRDGKTARAGMDGAMNMAANQVPDLWCRVEAVEQIIGIGQPDGIHRPEARGAGRVMGEDDDVPAVLPGARQLAVEPCQTGGAEPAVLFQGGVVIIVVGVEDQQSQRPQNPAQSGRSRRCRAPSERRRAGEGAGRGCPW